MKRNNVDPFGTTFLEEMRRLNHQRSPKVTQAPMKLLRSLKAGPSPLPKLMTSSDLDFRDFAKTVEYIENAGWISVSRKGLEEVAELTTLGSEIVDLKP